MTDLLPAQADAAFTLHREIVSLRRTIERDFLVLAAKLARVRDGRLFEVLGHPTFNSYLADPEIGLAHTTAFQLLRVHDVALLRGWRDAPEGNTAVSTQADVPLITAAETLAIGLKKTDLIRRKLIDATSETERREWKDKAMTTSVSDLRRELAAARGVDVDAAWRETTEYAARRFHQMAARLQDAVDRQAALAILDEVCAAAMAVRETLEPERVG